MGINTTQISKLDKINVFHHLYLTNSATSKLFLEMYIFQKCSLWSKISINMGINKTQNVFHTLLNFQIFQKKSRFSNYVY